MKVDPIPYHLAPIISVASVLLLWSVGSFFRLVYVDPNLNVALLFILGSRRVGKSLVSILAGWGIQRTNIPCWLLSAPLRR